MSDTKPTTVKPNLAVTHVLAVLLERLECSTVPVCAEQYRSVVTHLVNEFSEVPAGAALGALLDAHPAAAELYENLNYATSGLCCSSIVRSLAANQQAKAVIARAMGQSK
jgi:hypothetical protein